MGARAVDRVARSACGAPAARGSEKGRYRNGCRPRGAKPEQDARAAARQSLKTRASAAVFRCEREVRPCLLARLTVRQKKLTLVEHARLASIARRDVEARVNRAD